MREFIDRLLRPVPVTPDDVKQRQRVRLEEATRRLQSLRAQVKVIGRGHS